MAKLPISFKEFNESPVRGLLYLFMLAIVGLFTYLQINSANEKKLLKEQLLKCDTKNYTQDVEMKQLREQFLETASLMNNLKGKFETLEKLGKLQ